VDNDEADVTEEAAPKPVAKKPAGLKASSWPVPPSIKLIKGKSVLGKTGRGGIGSFANFQFKMCGGEAGAMKKAKAWLKKVQTQYKERMGK